MKVEQIPGLEIRSMLLVPLRHGDDTTQLAVTIPSGFSDTPEAYAEHLFALLDEMKPHGWVPDWKPEFRLQRLVKPMTDEEYKRLDALAKGRRTLSRMQQGQGCLWGLDPAGMWEDDWTMTRKILEIVAARKGI